MVVGARLVERDTWDLIESTKFSEARRGADSCRNGCRKGFSAS